MARLSPFFSVNTRKCHWSDFVNRQSVIVPTCQRLVAIAGVLFLAACGDSSKVSENGKSHTTNDASRLLQNSLEEGDWALHGRTHSEQRYSPLDTISRKSVSGMGLAWSYELKTDRGVEATPLVVDGVMYVTGAWSIVYALDAKSGRELWHYDPEVPRRWGQLVCCDVVNRGVAFLDGRIFLGTLDGRLVSLDAESGNVIWQQLTVDQSQPYSITGAPRVAKGKVFIGNGGADYGVRGYVSAYDALSGELEWRFYTVPGNPSDAPDGAASDDILAEIAEKTWTGEWWRYGGGGTVWDSIVYDPTTDYLYIGVGNGSPHDRNIRSPDGGDNLFLSSIVALDADTGKYVWHYQTTPGDSWDFTATQQIMLADVTIDGATRHVLWQAPKNGFFYVIDRVSGELLSAEPYTSVSWATHVDKTTGRPVETENARYEDGVVFIQPAVFGGHNWQPMSYSGSTGLVYIPATDTATPRSVDPMFRYTPGWWNTGNPGPAFPPDPDIISQIKAGARSYLRAWDPIRQESVWDVELIGPWNGGTLATAGDLVFQGTADGRFVAYDATDGTTLWEHRTGTATLAGPISYSVDGEQYVAVPGGFGSVLFLALGIIMPEAVPQQKGRVFAYRLGGNATLPETPETVRIFPPPPPVDSNAEVLDRGRDLYGYYCWQCHGANAVSSGVLPDLRLSPMLHSKAAWSDIVLRGTLSDRGMGSFGDWISEEDATAIRMFVASEAARVAPSSAK